MNRKLSIIIGCAIIYYITCMAYYMLNSPDSYLVNQFTIGDKIYQVIEVNKNDSKWTGFYYMVNCSILIFFFIICFILSGYTEIKLICIAGVIFVLGIFIYQIGLLAIPINKYYEYVNSLVCKMILAGIGIIVLIAFYFLRK